MDIELSAYDVALQRSPCCYVLEFDGQLQEKPLREGLHRVLQEYSELAGELKQHPSKADTFVIRAPQPSTAAATYNFTYQQQHVRPRMRTLLELWRAGVMPSLGQQLSAVQVTYFADCDCSLMVFTWDHLLMDVNSFQTIANRWMEVTAAVCNNVPPPGLDAAYPATITTSRLEYFGRPSYPVQAAGGDGATATSKQCWPPTLAVGETGSGNTALACKHWLAAHHPPFGEPLDTVGRCKAAWRMLAVSLRAHSVVGFLPRDVLEGWKAKAAAEMPLPAGHYSSAVATAALLAATLYLAHQAKYDRQGGLYVHFVINARGGRCGMRIPCNSIGNGSIWGARVWVPSANLAAAQGTATPALMHFLKTGLHKELRDRHGELNQQFAYWEALRGAGLSGKAHLMSHVRQLDGDIAVDYLPDVAGQLPSIPGTKLRSALFHWCLVSIPQTFLVTPTLPQDTCTRAVGSSSSTSEGSRSSGNIISSSDSSDSGSRDKQSCSCGSCGVRFEVCMPSEVAVKAGLLWQSQGVRLVSGNTGDDPDIHGAGGAMWSPLEVMVMPWFVGKAVVDLLTPLPLLLLELIVWLLQLLRVVGGASKLT